MTRLVLPALRANDSLGFLAALGVLALCEDGLKVPARLGWEGPDGRAVLDAPFADTHQLATALGDLAASWRTNAQLTPGEDPGLISAPLSGQARKALENAGALDPMKMQAAAAIDRFQEMQELELSRPGPEVRWLVGLVGQSSPAIRGESLRRLTPLYSPSGQMTLFQLYGDFLHAEQKSRPAAITEALLGWRRVKGPKEGAGANLDSRALIDGATSSGHKPANRHVPGATWLALQSAPWFTQVGDGVNGEAVAWIYPRGGGRLRWPVWMSLQTPDAVRVLLAHPAVRWVAPPAKEGAKAEQSRRLQARRERERGVLGVCALYEARRRALSKSAGPLLPPILLWQA